LLLKRIARSETLKRIPSSIQLAFALPLVGTAFGCLFEMDLPTLARFARIAVAGTSFGKDIVNFPAAGIAFAIDRLGRRQPFAEQPRGDGWIGV
jgi:hypothetical protein